MANIISAIDWKQLFDQGILREVISPETGDTYTLTKFLGKGGFGTVFKGHNQQLDQDFAIKLMTLNSEHAETDFLEETTAYRILSNAPSCQLYIVCMYDAFRVTINGNPVGVIITELMDGDLWKIPTQDDEVGPLINALLNGIAYIHDHGFAHRDLKPGNVLRKGKIFKVSDLGLICGQDVKYIPTCSYVGTPIYSSPTSVRRWGRETSVANEQKEDIWGLGMTLYTIIFGEFPPEIQTEQDIANLTQEKIYLFINESTPYPRSEPEIISGQDIIYLLVNMLRINPNERWNIYQLLDYFNQHVRSQVKPIVPQGFTMKPMSIVSSSRTHQVFTEPMLVESSRRTPRGFTEPMSVESFEGTYTRPFSQTVYENLPTNTKSYRTPYELMPPIDTPYEPMPPIGTPYEPIPDMLSEEFSILTSQKVCQLIDDAIRFSEVDPELSEYLFDLIETIIESEDLDLQYLSDCLYMYEEDYLTRSGLDLNDLTYYTRQVADEIDKILERLE